MHTVERVAKVTLELVTQQLLHHPLTLCNVVLMPEIKYARTVSAVVLLGQSNTN